MTIDDDIQQKISYNNSHLKVYNIPAQKSNNLGRPSKGSTWILPKQLNSEFKIISSRISTIKISEIIIFGVYLPYYDGKEDSCVEFESEIELLNSLCTQSQNNSEQVILLGDFNSDLNRKKPT